METWQWIVVAALAAVGALLVIGVIANVRRRRSRLKERFGPEYHRAVSSGSRREAERKLSEVEKEHEELNIRPLPGPARERYLDEWRQAESRFVSDPREAALTAERILRRVLEERGYPVDEKDPDHQAAHLAADYPDVAERFRHGRAMIDRVDGAQATEDLRKAMIDFRIVLEELLESRPAA